MLHQMPLLRLLLAMAAILLSPAVAQALEPVLSVTLDGPVEIDRNNHYAETSWLHVRALYPPEHPRAGQVMRDYSGMAHVEEWRTEVYDGRFGATRLPFAVPIEQGEGLFALHSVARFKMIEQRRAPIPQVAIYLGERSVLVNVPQWVDSDGNERIDWLEHQVADIIDAAQRRAPGPVRDAISAVTDWSQSWRRDCGGVLPETPTIIRIGAACLNTEGENAHRFDEGRELTATILHEARHVWVHRNPGKALLPRVFNTHRNGRSRCDTAGDGQCGGSSYVFDAGAVQAHENDAEIFAQRYKDSF